MKTIFTKNLFFVFLAVFFITAANGQGNNCMFYKDKKLGSYWEMTTYKHNGKVQSISLSTLTAISETDSTTNYFLEVQTLNKKRKPWMGSKPQLQVTQVFRDEPYYLVDMSGGMQTKGDKYVKYSCDPDTQNNNMPDIHYEYTRTERSGTETRTEITTIDLVDFKYASGTEKVKTDRGEFECSKMTYTIKFGGNGITLATREQYCTVWTSNEYGQVKSEARNKKGELLRYAELTDYKFL